MLIGYFVAIVAVLARIAVPLPTGIPLTLQMVGVFLAGSILGGRKAAAVMGVYLLLGAVGAPVFAYGTGGLGIIMGKSGGYLLGFVGGVYLLGKIAEAVPEPGFWRLALGMTLCLFVVYVCGTAYLAFLTGLGLRELLFIAVLPYLPFDAGKIVGSAFLAVLLRQVLAGAGLLPGRHL